MSKNIVEFNKDLCLTPLIGVLQRQLTKFYVELEDLYVLKNTLDNEESYSDEEDGEYGGRKNSRGDSVARRIDQLERNFAIYADLIRKSSADEIKRRKISTETVDVEQLNLLMVDLQKDLIDLAKKELDQRFLPDKIAERLQVLSDAINNE